MGAPVTLTGQYGTADINPGVGYVDIVPAVSQANAKIVVVQDEVRATLDGDGRFTVDIIASDDPGWVQGPIPYIFREYVDGRVAQWMAYVNAAGPYDISELVPLEESPDFYVPVPGPPNVLTVQSTTTILPGLPADVQISGTSPSQELNFWIPAGQKGDPGISGAPHIGPDEPTDPQVTEWYDTDEESPRGVRVDGDTMLGPLHLVAGSTAAQPPPGDDSTLVATTAFVHDTVTGDVDLSGLIPKSLVDAKGDLIVATAADTVARLPVGATTGHVLTVDPAEAAGVKWAAAAGGGAADGSHRWWTSYAAGAYASPSVVAGNFATVAATTGYIYWCPFFCVATTTFDRMRIYTNQVASGLVRLGIYDATGTGGRAGARILDAGTIATDGAAGDKDLTISQSLTGSTWYWLALTVNRTITVSAFPHTIMAAMPVANLSPGGGAQFASVYSDFTYGALPATAPASVPGLVNAGIVLRAA